MNLFRLPLVFGSLPLALYTALLGMDSDEDKLFMAELYISHKEQLNTYAASLCSSRQDAEDSVQNVFLSLIPKVSELRSMHEDRLKAYLFAAVKNAAYAIHRKEKRMEQAEEDSRSLSGSDHDRVPVSEYTFLDLMEALPTLSDRDQALLRMKYFLGQADSEIAEELNVQPGSVRTLVWRARQRLIASLEEGDGKNA